MQLVSSAQREATEELSVNRPKRLAKWKKMKILVLGEIGTETNNTFWSVDPMLNNAQVRFKIDTRADVTVIPDKIYEAL